VSFTVHLETFLSPQPEAFGYFDMTWSMSVHLVHRFERFETENFYLAPHSSSSNVDKKNSGRAVPDKGDTSASPPTSYLNNTEADCDKKVADQSKIGWHMYGIMAGILIELDSIAHGQLQDFAIHAPEQMMDQDQIARWHQSQQGFRCSHLSFASLGVGVIKK
jgi:hypothetical protein